MNSKKISRITLTRAPAMNCCMTWLSAPTAPARQPGIFPQRKRPATSARSAGKGKPCTQVSGLPAMSRQYGSSGRHWRRRLAEAILNTTVANVSAAYARSNAWQYIIFVISWTIISVKYSLRCHPSQLRRSRSVCSRKLKPTPKLSKPYETTFLP